ncbi:MAG: ABC transporter permease [Saprospiraceae bacterium]
MFKNYLTIALRYFMRNKLYTAINILGLSIGIAACLVIFLIVNFESNFDKFWQDQDRIYRVYSKFTGAFEGINRGVTTALAPWMADNMTGVAQAAPFHIWSATVTVEGITKLERQAGIVIVDPAYFAVFSNYKWLAGSPAESLGEPNQVVLTPEKTKQYFGLEKPEQAMGRTLVYKDSIALTVSGIVEPPRPSSDLDFKEFISFSTIAHGQLRHDIALNEWGSTSSSSQLFVKLQPDTDISYIEAQLEGARTANLAQDEDNEYAAHFQLQPLDDVHFNSKIGIFDHSRSPAHRSTLFLLSMVAILLLVIAAINFINLETAQAMRRAREVGVRKVLGGTRQELIIQFLTSTFLLTVIAVIMALCLTQWAIGFYEDFIPQGLTFNPLNLYTLGFILLLILSICLIAGGYPAIVLSSFLPVKALKDKVFSVGSSGSGVNLRRSLVVFQFVVAQILIFGTLTVGQQIKFMLNKDMGFDKDAIVYFYTPWRDTTNRKATLIQELKRLPEVVAISNHQAPPAQTGYSTSIMKFRKGEEELTHNVHQKYGDTAYINLYGMKLLAGRNLMPSDTVKEFIINETYSRQLGFDKPEDALNQYISFNKALRPIVGVVADFHLQPLHNTIEPTAIANRTGNCISLKFRTTGKSMGDFAPIIAKVEAQWKQLYPEDVLKYQFMDEAVAKFYKREQQTAKLVKTATTMAILICCLGLFGLISFTTTQRTKEIGIRKILGASVMHIVGILTQNFLLLVLIALLLASPFAWWLSQQWLQDFAYQTELHWWQFALVGVIGLAITLLTVSFHSFRAATANPVESLRHE